MSTWKVAGVQMDCRLADKEFNLQVIRERLAVAAAAGARLIVFPEAILSGYGFKSVDEAWAYAEPLPGPATQTLGMDCRRLGVSIAFGLLERQGDRLYNACALVGPGGFQARYRKAHLPFLGIDRYAAPGDTPFEVHDLGGLRIGINICYDMCFPEIARMHALRGAELIVFPSAWPCPDGADESDPRLMPYVLFPRARAWENQCYVVTSNIVGKADVGDVSYYGRSRIIDPMGQVIADTGEAEGIVIEDIDLKTGILDARTGPFFGYNILKDRRPDIYEGIDASHPFEPEM